jgi:hypothetical protein
MNNKIRQWLKNRGLPEKIITDLLQYLPEQTNQLPIDDFNDAERIMHSDSWFYWPDQTRFIVVGGCPNGDAVAIDTEKEQGAIFYVAHELIGMEYALEEMVIKVASSPSDYVEKRSDDEFPWDYWEAKNKMKTE